MCGSGDAAGGELASAGLGRRGTVALMARFDALRAFLLSESRKCVRPPVGRFEHPWLSPMPLSAAGEALLRARGAGGVGEDERGRQAPQSDVFSTGDYSLGMFHHDVSEASIELLHHREFVAVCRGSLLCFLDTMRGDGRVHRVELPHKSHEMEPSKPVMAQFALRCVESFEAIAEGEAWLAQHDVYDRLAQFIVYLEARYTGMHGLFLAHSALQTGFDNDLLTVGSPERTVEDPGISAMMVLEYEAMAQLASRLGRTTESSRWTVRAERLRRLMNDLMWYEPGDGMGFYAALRWRHGSAQLGDELVTDGGDHRSVAPLCTWVSLLPLYAGVPDEARAKKLCALLLDEGRYWGPVGVRTCGADSPYFNQAARDLIYDQRGASRGPVSNWQGPVWVLSNFYMAEGLARYGLKQEARELAVKTAELCAADLAATGSLHECYADDGHGLWPACGGFVSWNVLALTLLDRHA